MKGKNSQNMVKIKYDDKGRKIYDFSDFNFDKNEDVHLENKPKDINEYLDYNEIHNKDLVVDSKKRGAFLCSVCNINMKDSGAYIEHLNGKLHNSKLGNNLKVKKITLEEVREKLLSVKRKSDIELMREKLIK